MDQKISNEMKIANVTLISKGISNDTLSYFTTKEIEIGDIVSVPLRNRTIDAIVVSIETASSAKLKIRSSAYSLKKIKENKGSNFFLPELVKAFEETANFYASSVGSVINSIVPKTIFSNIKDFRFSPSSEKAKENKNLINETVVLQADNERRMISYKHIIRGEFARGKSIFICLPQITDIEEAKKELEKGIEEYTFILHSKISKSKLIPTWNKILEMEHPVLIIATGPFLSIPRKDIKTIILDKEGSSSYKIQTRPYIDIRTFVKFFAKHQEARLILGDVFLRPETIWQHREGETAELHPLQFRSLSDIKQEMVDMRTYKKIKDKFVIIGDELNDLIRHNIENNENLFILVARRGLSTTTICRDCGNIVSCPNCHTPLILHKKERQNIFTCHKCGYETDQTDKCQTCYSWKLTPLGVGIEGVEATIKKNFSKADIWKIDKDSTTIAQAKEKINKFMSTPGSILIGTEMSLPHLPNIDNTAIASIDSLFAIPDFRINEKIFRMLLKVRSLTSKHFIIQTRQFEEKIFDMILKGDILAFYKQEIKEREMLGYPPFNLFIKISYTGEKKRSENEMGKLTELLKKFEPIIFPAFAPESKGKHTIHLVIKMKPGKWPDQNLIEILSQILLPFKINVDPISLL